MGLFLRERGSRNLMFRLGRMLVITILPIGCGRTIFPNFRNVLNLNEERGGPRSDLEHLGLICNRKLGFRIWKLNRRILWKAV
ncbi:hypothetical protein EDC01DRAFT_683379 [Geopyxis carbonaria]|nr:hypothetical protein EDC01DRAFT_683379 [Geopyxis carbonaria]